MIDLIVLVHVSRARARTRARRADERACSGAMYSGVPISAPSGMAPTPGHLLDELAAPHREAGLTEVTVSLDSLVPTIFAQRRLRASCTSTSTWHEHVLVHEEAS